MDRARAAARVIPLLSASIPANMTPTAIPSGILWSVTAKISMVVFRNAQAGPSGSSQSICR